MNPYEVLGLTREATEADIRKAYRTISKKHHPDAGATADREKFEEATRAYNVLGDEFSRAQYDKTGEMPDDEPDNTEGDIIAIAIRFFGMTHESMGEKARFYNIITQAKTRLQGEIIRLRGEVEKANEDARKFQDVLDRLTVKEGRPNFIATHIRAGMEKILKARANLSRSIDMHGRAIPLLDDFTWRTDSVPAPETVTRSPTEQLGQVHGFGKTVVFRS